MELLTTGNPKMIKGEKMGYMSFILHLAPANISGYNTCPMASFGCMAGCLNTSGRGIYQRTQDARIRRTQMFFAQRDTFMQWLIDDILAGIRKAERHGLIPVFRLNGTSDIRWENVHIDDYGRTIFDRFACVQFYDYTKLPNRKDIPSNYHLTFSLSEDNDLDAVKTVMDGRNVAVVYRKVPTSTSWWPVGQLTVIDGDEHDLRFLDPKGVIVGLKAKGKARKDMSGFVK